MSFVIYKKTQVVIDNEVVFTDINPFDINKSINFARAIMNCETKRLLDSGFGFSVIAMSDDRATLNKVYDHGHVITVLHIEEGTVYE